MKLVIHPAVETERLAPSRRRHPRPSGSTRPMKPRRSRRCPGPTPSWARSRRRCSRPPTALRWVQTFTASLEHYMFPALEAHPCVLTNVRGLFGDVIADQVMGYVLCFARNLHTYIRQQVEHRYEPAGGESARVSNLTGPGVSTPWTGRRSTCPTPRWGSSAWAGSAARSRGGRGRSGSRSAASTASPSGSSRSRASRRSWASASCPSCSAGATSP